MALFCPNCHNIVTIHVEVSLYLYCHTCNYKYKVEKKIYHKLELDNMDKLISTDAIDTDNRDMSKTQAVCPKCTHDEAYFYSMQLRSADEPSTLFFTCVKCSHQWKE